MLLVLHFLRFAEPLGTESRGRSTNPAGGSLLAGLLIVLVAASAELLAQIPLAAIGAMLILVAWGLLDLARFERIKRQSRTEFALALSTLMATLTLRLEIAILLGTLLSLVAYLYRTSHPAIRALLPDPSDPGRRFTPIDELPAPLPECPQLKLVRVGGSIYFGAVQHVADHLQAFRTQCPSQKFLLAMTKSMNFIDLAGTEMWEAELAERRAMGGDLYFHRPRGQVLRAWTRSGYTDALGADHIFPSKQVAIGSIYQRLDPNVCATCTARVFLECQGYSRPPEPEPNS